MRILIADDDPICLEMLKKTLEMWGHEVVTFADGEQAWAALQMAGSPRIAILDWQMPGFRGPEICRMLRQAETERYTHVILLSARSEKTDVAEGINAGADDYIVKPANIDELKARLNTAARVVRIHDELMAAQAALSAQVATDSLTGVGSRFSILETLEKEQARAARERSTFGVALVDLDGFSWVNDTLGHLIGDRVLVEAAQRMRQVLRPTTA